MGCQVSETLSVPNASQTSSSASSLCATITANTTTSVSTVRISISGYGHVVQHSSIRVSASSWLHGVSECMSCCGNTQRTCSPSVTTSSLLSSSNDWMSAFERKLKSSCLLRSTHRKLCQFPGMVADATTRRHTPFPRFALAVAFRESTT